LDKRQVQLSLKRLRKAVAARKGPPLRYFLIGEYSPAGRPHYHLILFNYFPPDAVQGYRSHSGGSQFTSDELSKAWGLGMVNFQMFTPSAADYVSGYYVDKLSGDLGERELAGREPEFMRSSRGGAGGIGAPFLVRFGAQIHEGADFVVIGGRQVPVPKFFERKLEKSDRDAWGARLEARQSAGLDAAKREAEASPGVLPWERSEVKAKVAEAKRRALSRSIVERGAA